MWENWAWDRHYFFRRHSRGTLWYDLCYGRIVVVVVVVVVVVDVRVVPYECISVCMQYANRSNWKCLDNCLFFTSQIVVFSPLLSRAFTREFPVPGTAVSSERYSYPYPNFLFSFCLWGTHKTILGVFTLGITLQKNFCNFCRTRTRDLCELCTTLPVPGTSVSSVRHSYPYPNFFNFVQSVGVHTKPYPGHLPRVLPSKELLELL